MNDSGKSKMTDHPRMRLIESVRDNRGRLRIFEEGNTLRFTPVRCFVISDVPVGETRGGHAVSCDEFVVVLTGSCVAVVSNDGRLDEYALDDQGGGLHVPKETWFRLEEFEPGAMVAVFASEKFRDTVYLEA